MNIPTTISLAEAVTRYPSLARELEVRGLDYCCGGAMSLDEASRKRGLDPHTVADELTQAIDDDRPATWATMGVVQLVDHVVDTHHRYLWDELPQVATLMDKVLTVHGRLIEYVREAPAELLIRETRFRRRLRLDTWGHYPKHAAAIRAWRDRR